MVSSTRFRNSGRKCARSSLNTASRAAGSISPLRVHALEQERRADVAGHDDDGVAEVDGAAVRVGEPAVVEDLQQHVEHVVVRLLDLVEQHHRVRAPAHGLGELAALVVADVAGRRADQARDGVLLHVLGHVDAHHVLFGVEQRRGERLGELGLAHAGRAQEDERADRAARVLDARAGAQDGVGHALHGLVLADHPLVQHLVEVQELLALGLDELRDGDARSSARRSRRSPPRSPLRAAAACRGRSGSSFSVSAASFACSLGSSPCFSSATRFRS